MPLCCLTTAAISRVSGRCLSLCTGNFPINYAYATKSLDQLPVMSSGHCPPACQCLCLYLSPSHSPTANTGRTSLAVWRPLINAELARFTFSTVHLPVCACLPIPLPRPPRMQVPAGPHCERGGLLSQLPHAAAQHAAVPQHCARQRGPLAARRTAVPHRGPSQP